MYRVGVPFFAYIFSKEQNSLLKGLSEVVLHLDATGSIIRKTHETDKRVYYYAGVIQLSNNQRVCPVFEMVSSVHDASAIANWLLHFKTYYISNKNQWSEFKKVVTDFSFAFINASVLVFNNIDLAEYLQITLDHLHFRKPYPTLFKSIFVAKLMADLICECDNAEEDRQVVKKLVAAAFNLNWSEFCLWFKNFHLLTVCKFDGRCISDALREIARISLKEKYELINNPVDVWIYSELDQNNDLNQERSAFLQHFKNITDSNAEIIATLSPNTGEDCVRPKT